MKLREYLKEKNITIYSLSKNTGIPRTTLNDLIHEKYNLTECKYSTLKKLSNYLEIGIEDIVDNDIFICIKEIKKRRIGKNNGTGVSGVCYHKSSCKYKAYIKLLERNIQIGLYDSLEEAVAARKAAEKIIEYLKIKELI